jgi:predicted type IV restriction endonuclease
MPSGSAKISLSTSSVGCALQGGCVADKFPTELAEGHTNLGALLIEIAATEHDWNEANARFQIIDRLLETCFGWPRKDIKLETPQGREYSDYELGSPPVAIWEAKREGKIFEIPVKRTAGLVHRITSIKNLSPNCGEAIEQVNAYCLSRGCELAVATNGRQIVAFQAEKDLSLSRCLVFDGLEQLRTAFGRAWQILSPGGVREKNLFKLIEKNSFPAAPEKLSASIPNYPQLRAPSDLQRSMTDLAELLLLSVEEQADLEKRFYEECYCESGALGQHALISKQMLMARYASLFPDAEDAPRVRPASAKRSAPQLTPEILGDAISNRPIALVGDVGVGKSSFLKHLMYVSAFDEFQHAIYIYVDLGLKALAPSVVDLTLNQIDETLNSAYSIDITEASFVRSVYKKDIRRFNNSIYGQLKESNPKKYEDELLNMLMNKQSNKAEHLRLSINFLAKERRKQIIIALDNSDQRSAAVQQEAFVIAQNLSADWQATVFISVRPRTFFLSKRSGALSAYPHRIFTIAPPRLDEALERRLRFAVEVAEGRIQIDRLKSVTFKLHNVVTLIKIMLTSIEKQDEVKIFLENITAGNVRELIQFLTGMFGNPNVDMQGLVIALERSGEYLMPVHEFWKVALKGDYQYYDPARVLACNLFNVRTDNPHDHFVLPLILAFLNDPGPRATAEGFVGGSDIQIEMQKLGFRSAVVDASLRAANNKKLIEAPERITFEEDEDGLYGFMPAAFRLSSIGAYHLKVWMTSFAYLDAVCVDTPIFGEIPSMKLRESIRSFALQDRYDRAICFREYLSEIWVAIGICPDYFDWEAACRAGQYGFDRVANALRKRGVARGN